MELCMSRLQGSEGCTPAARWFIKKSWAKWRSHKPN